MPLMKPISKSFYIPGPGLSLPAHFSPIFFPMGNAATGFFVTFALIAGVVGAGLAISGINHIRSWNSDSLPSAASAAIIAWTLTLLAMGYFFFFQINLLRSYSGKTFHKYSHSFKSTCCLACKEIDLRIRNARLRTMEAFLIILSVTQFIYILAIHGAASQRRR